MKPTRRVAGLGLAGSLLAAVAQAEAPELVVLDSRHGFDALVGRTEAAAVAHGLVVVATASASRAAAGRGIAIPGDAVVLVFNNQLAVRMLAASRAAGLEAPLHLHVTEAAGGARLAYRRPSAVFGRYGVAALDALASELDLLIAAVAAAAVRDS